MSNNRRGGVIKITATARIDHDAKTAGGSSGWVADTVGIESPTSVLKTAGDNTRSKLKAKLLCARPLLQDQTGRTIPTRVESTNCPGR